MEYRNGALEGVGSVSNWSGRRALVTGATGLVGSWLVKALLEKGASVVCLIRDWDPQSELIRSGIVNETSVVSGRLEDFEDVHRAIVDHETDTVFHLGAQAIVGSALRSPYATFEANIRGTYNLLEACRLQSDLVKRVAVASSDKAYGTADVLPYTEDMPAQGRHPYDVSKSCTDLIAATYHETYGLPVAIARCGNIYGGGDLNWSRIVPGTIRSLYQGQRPVLRSDGTFLRDYVYVQDAAEVYMQLAEGIDREEVRGEAFNFGPAKPSSVVEIVKKIGEVMGREDLEPVILNQARAEIKDQYLDSSKAARLLNLPEPKPLEVGLCETVEWYEKYLGRAA